MLDVGTDGVGDHRLGERELRAPGNVQGDHGVASLLADHPGELSRRQRQVLRVGAVPVQHAGILLARRVRRAAPLPNSVRVSASIRSSATVVLLGLAGCRRDDRPEGPATSITVRTSDPPSPQIVQFTWWSRGPRWRVGSRCRSRIVGPSALQRRRNCPNICGDNTARRRMHRACRYAVSAVTRRVDGRYAPVPRETDRSSMVLQFPLVSLQDPRPEPAVAARSPPCNGSLRPIPWALARSRGGPSSDDHHNRGFGVDTCARRCSGPRPERYPVVVVSYDNRDIATKSQYVRDVLRAPHPDNVMKRGFVEVLLEASRRHPTPRCARRFRVGAHRPQQTDPGRRWAHRGDDGRRGHRRPAQQGEDVRAGSLGRRALARDVRAGERRRGSRPLHVADRLAVPAGAQSPLPAAHR